MKKPSSSTEENVRKSEEKCEKTRGKRQMVDFPDRVNIAMDGKQEKEFKE